MKKSSQETKGKSVQKQEQATQSVVPSESFQFTEESCITQMMNAVNVANERKGPYSFEDSDKLNQAMQVLEGKSEKFTKEASLNGLMSALVLAQSRGAFTIPEAAHLLAVIKFVQELYKTKQAEPLNVE
jgi:predicted ATP-grasp superfamily ATP-dependent carboligase